MDILKHSKTRKFDSRDDEVKFLLGGIGTGNISVGSRGQLTDFEIFNEPSKNRFLPYTFFAVHTRFAGGGKDTRVLEAELNAPHKRPLGYFSSELAGLKRFQNGKISSMYPFVQTELSGDDLPLKVTMTAYTPFIPLDSDNSGLPGCYFEYRIKNDSAEDAAVSVCGSFANPVGFAGYDLFSNLLQKEEVENSFLQKGKLSGVVYTSKKLDKKDRYYGDMCFLTDEEDISCKPEWVDGAWWDGVHDFWDDFSEDGELNFKNEKIGRASEFDAHSRVRIGSLAVKKTIPAGEERTFRFMLCWHFPNRANRWEGHLLKTNADKKEQTVKNYYAHRFSSALAVAEYMFEKETYLREYSEKFADAMYGSTLPCEVIDAVMSTMTVIRSTTCFRVGESGQFLCWEGCFDHKGSCEGNCTHVWNYAQTLAFLFPDLERGMRELEFLKETDEEGNMTFRSNSVFGDPRWEMVPATDGQLGCVIRLYREYLFSGDKALVQRVWSKVVKCMDFAFKTWDSDGDGLLDSKQHNTYDIEFYGPNSLSNTIFFTALKAAARLARVMGDGENEKKWTAAFESASEKMDKLLFDGEYYVQTIDDIDEYKYQYGTGCLSDQVFGQLLAHVNGLGYILPKEHVKSAISSVYRYNFREKLSEHQNVQRCYALNDDSGLLVCSWPHGGRPKFPFVYSDEVWTGIEYQVAAHLIYEGYKDEGVRIVKAVRDRHDGKKRNPFNEVECGNHYARSLASYGVYLALTGYRCDMPAGKVSFDPKETGDTFRCFYSTGKSWGIYTAEKKDGKVNQSLITLFGDPDCVKIENGGKER